MTNLFITRSQNTSVKFGGHQYNYFMKSLFNFIIKFKHELISGLKSHALLNITFSRSLLVSFSELCQHLVFVPGFISRIIFQRFFFALSSSFVMHANVTPSPPPLIEDSSTRIPSGQVRTARNGNP